MNINFKWTSQICLILVIILLIIQYIQFRNIWYENQILTKKTQLLVKKLVTCNNNTNNYNNGILLKLQDSIKLLDNTLKYLSNKIEDTDRFILSDTIQIIKKVIKRIEQDSIGFVTQHQRVIIPKNYYFDEINFSFKLKNTDIYTKYVGQIRYELPANYIDFIQFKLSEKNNAQISIEFGKQKISFYLKKKKYWVVYESIWID